MSQSLTFTAFAVQLLLGSKIIHIIPRHEQKSCVNLIFNFFFWVGQKWLHTGQNIVVYFCCQHITRIQVIFSKFHELDLQLFNECNTSRSRYRKYFCMNLLYWKDQAGLIWPHLFLISSRKAENVLETETQGWWAQQTKTDLKNDSSCSKNPRFSLWLFEVDPNNPRNETRPLCRWR